MCMHVLYVFVTLCRVFNSIQLNSAQSIGVSTGLWLLQLCRSSMERRHRRGNTKCVPHYKRFICCYRCRCCCLLPLILLQPFQKLRQNKIITIIFIQSGDICSLRMDFVSYFLFSFSLSLSQSIVHFSIIKQKYMTTHSSRLKIYFGGVAATTTATNRKHVKKKHRNERERERKANLHVGICIALY